jgi:hypothetical protein
MCSHSHQACARENPVPTTSCVLLVMAIFLEPTQGVFPTRHVNRSRGVLIPPLPAKGRVHSRDSQHASDGTVAHCLLGSPFERFN